MNGFSKNFDGFDQYFIEEKKKVVIAKHLKKDSIIHTEDGSIIAKKGDWLVEENDRLMVLDIFEFFQLLTKEE